MLKYNRGMPSAIIMLFLSVQCVELYSIINGMGYFTSCSTWKVIKIFFSKEILAVSYASCTWSFQAITNGGTNSGG